MASVTLDKPDIGLVSDMVGTRLAIAHLLRADVDEIYDSAAVHFDGQAYPTRYRGQHRDGTVSCLARFGEREHAEAVALVALFRRAHAATDGRLMLRTNGGNVAGFDEAYVGEVVQVPRTRLVGMSYDIPWTLQLVYFSVAV